MSGGRYQAYPEYKDLGVEWVDRIPKSWQVSPLKRLCQIDNSGCYGDEAGAQQNDIPVATTAQIDKDGRFHVERMPVRSFSLAESKRYLCQQGEILVVKSSGSADNIISGKAGYIDTETPLFIFSNFLLRLKPITKLAFPKYLYYFITSHLTSERIKRMVSATTYPNLQVNNYISAYVTHPGYSEQNQIANFLDHETAKIDTLIEKQQHLIALLKEKRQAVISHAVTKGLNPDAPMKDSGVEWLGEVPEHWDICRIKHIVHPDKNSMVDGPFGSSVNTDTDYVAEGIPVIRTVNIANSGFSCENLKFMREQKYKELQRHAVYPGDVLFSKVGTIGNTCILPQSIPEAILSTTGSCKITVNENLYLAEYLVLCIQLMHQDLILIANSNVQPFLNMANIKNLLLPLPKVEEQAIILEKMKDKVTIFDDSIEKATVLKELLQERRTALISAAVTGKIDVRNWQPPTASTTTEATP